MSENNLSSRKEKRFVVQRMDPSCVYIESVSTVFETMVAMKGDLRQFSLSSIATESPKVVSINTDHSIAAELDLEESFRGTSKCESEDGQANTIMSKDKIRLQGFNRDGVAVARGRLATAFAQGKAAKVVVDEVTETIANKDMEECEAKKQDLHRQLLGARQKDKQRIFLIIMILMAVAAYVYGRTAS